jgi:anti-sigma B factor antagonist
MEFAVESINPGVAVIRGVGKLNMVSAPTLRSVVTKTITDHGSRIVVDLSGVEFMDSSGLGALVSALKTTRQAGGDLRISAPSAQVQMVLKLSNLDRVLAAYSSPAEAYRD